MQWKDASAAVSDNDQLAVEALQSAELECSGGDTPTGIFGNPDQYRSSDHDPIIVGLDLK